MFIITFKKINLSITLDDSIKQMSVYSIHCFECLTVYKSFKIVVLVETSPIKVETLYKVLHFIRNHFLKKTLQEIKI